MLAALAVDLVVSGLTERVTGATLHTGGAGENGTTLAILGLAVLPDRRRQGIAAQLMHAYLDRARQGGMERVVLTCKENLIPFYEQFGFVNRGVSQSVHGGVVWYDMEYTI